VFEYIKKEEDFIALDVMIQMEYCSGQTLREYLDRRDRKIDR
jgi:hypothetical protein